MEVIGGGGLVRGDVSESVDLLDVNGGFVAGGAFQHVAGVKEGFAASAQSPLLSTLMKASCGMLTLPNIFIFFFPSFCFSSSFRFREISPP